ncbi:hypothetical protein BJP47_23335 [Paenibacillus odorifer]|nr:hypothetical protein BJP47_23335 [Paenibacillus odorifer]
MLKIRKNVIKRDYRDDSKKPLSWIHGNAQSSITRDFACLNNGDREQSDSLQDKRYGLCEI